MAVVHGFSLHRELELLAEAGLPHWDVLRSATTIPGQLMKQRIGVEDGDLANLLILNSNPLARISNTRDVHGVIYAGEWVDRNALQEGLLEMTPSASEHD